MQMSDLKLIEPEHVYKLGDRTIPGVTDTIQANFGTRPWYSEWHAGKGKAVHLAIHYLVTNQLNWRTVDSKIESKIKAFQKFLAETGFKVVDSELKLFSKRHQFAGMIDLILKDQNERLIIADIKSSIEPTAILQLAGYSLLYDENYSPRKANKAYVIELKDSGDYKLQVVQNLKQKQRIFLACLTVANWRNQHYGK